MTRPTPVALHHTCFVVHDIEAAARSLSEALGIGPWNIWTIEPEKSTVRGVEQHFSFRVALAEVGGGTYELIMPHVGKSVYDEHLEQSGNGFHHTCVVYPTMQAMHEAKAALLDDGRTMLQEGSGGDVFSFAYFEFPEIGSPIELLFLDPGKLPAPELVI